MPNKTILLSIHEEYAEAILNGTKTYELRRIRPKIGPGDHVLLYVTAPVSAICGYFEVEEVLTGSPSGLWGQVKGSAHLTRNQVYKYLTGANEPCALKIRKAHRLCKKLSIKDIEKSWAGFRVPQSYRYVPRELSNTITAREVFQQSSHTGQEGLLHSEKWSQKCSVT